MIYNMKTEIISIILSISLLTNCQTKTREKEIDKTEELSVLEQCDHLSSKKVEKKESLTINELSEPERTVYDFYIWYLGEIYNKKNKEVQSVPSIIIENNKYLTNNNYINFLNLASHYLSSSFLDREFERMRVCDSLLNTLVVDDEHPMYKYYEFSNEIVNKYFYNFSHFYWVKGQGEQIDSVEIVSSSIDSITGNVFVNMITKPDNFIQFKLNINVTKENDIWKIDKIIME